MDRNNTIEFELFGEYALFTDPATRVGGEKSSYDVPTYESIKGVTKNIYWKPTFMWYIEKIRIMNPIRKEHEGTKPLHYGGGNDLATYTYLTQPKYQVRAHFDWNMFRKDLEQDRKWEKHSNIAHNLLELGGKRDISLGLRNCQGYVEPKKFGSDEGFYDKSGRHDYGMMFHSFSYPDETGVHELHSNFWKCKMINGVIEFPKPANCEYTKFIKYQKPYEDRRR